MLIRLTRDARVHHKAGEIVEVSPAEASYLMATRCGMPAVPEGAAKEVPETPAPSKTRKASKK